MKKHILQAFIIATLITTASGWAMGWISARIYFSDRIENGYTKTTSKTSESMLSLINVERNAAGIPSITSNDGLARAAKAKACDMKEKAYFDHKDPSGEMGWHFIDEQRVDWQHAGENLAKGTTDPEVVMKSLMNSPTHKANIMDKKWSQVGYASCGEYTVQFYTD